MIDIDALGAAGPYRSRKRERIIDTAGDAVAELTIAPALYMTRSLSAIRRSPPLRADDRRAALALAADAFANKVIGGLDFDAYVRLVATVSGLPMPAARHGAYEVARGLADAFDAVSPACPAGACPEWRERPPGGTALWVRRGDVLAVLASGNAPGVHAQWPQALALGYRVAVRPSRREPFTAYRLVEALRQNGFRDSDVVFLPTDYAGADELVACADLAMVYGGQDVADRHAADPTVLVNGPGRTKILITADHSWRDHLDVIVASVAHLGGMACVNATAVFCEDDAAGLADALAQRLSAIEPLPVTDENAVLPVQPLSTARALADVVAAKAVGATALLGAEQIVADLGNGYAALRPAVHLVDRPDAEVMNVELAFPCVWVSPWSPEDGTGPLRESLVVAAITGDGELIDALVDEPSIANVYGSGYPTYFTAPGVPHDGFLADFLMRCKGFALGQASGTKRFSLPVDS